MLLGPRNSLDGLRIPDVGRESSHRSATGTGQSARMPAVNLAARAAEKGARILDASSARGQEPPTGERSGLK